MAAYVTAADIRAYLQQVPATEDTLLGTIATRATAIVEEALGFSFGDYTLATSNVTVYSYGLHILRLPPHQQGSVAAVTEIYGGPVAGWAEDSDGNLYIGTASFFYGAAWGTGRYIVSARWGYGPVPESVKEVTLELAINIWRGKDRGMWQDVIGVEGGGALRFTGGLTNQQRAILEAVKARYAPGVVV